MRAKSAAAPRGSRRGDDRWTATNYTSAIEGAHTNIRNSHQVSSAPIASTRRTNISDAATNTRTEGLDEREPELRAFNAALQARAPRAWATPALVVVNVLVFIACIVAGAGSWALDPQALTRWGSNAGMLVMGGEWHRLFTAMFLHGDLLHLSLNLWALWSIGRLVERLYGTWAFIFIYIVSGVVAGLASIAWNPHQNSVGASGAIFALLGALIVFMSRASTRVPKRVVRTHGLTALAFILYSGVIGMLSDKIDNAAHLGGLICGGLLGWSLARPLDESTRLSFGKASAAGITALLVLGLGVAQLHALSSNQSAVQRYWANHPWLLTGQNEALRIDADMQARAAAGKIGEAEFLGIMEQKLLPFWKEAETRLAAEPPVQDEQQQKFAAAMTEYVKLRHDAIRTGYEGVKNRDKERLLASRRFAQRADFALSNITRLEMRAEADRIRSWSRAQPVRQLRYALAGLRRRCEQSQTLTASADGHRESNAGLPGKSAGGCAAQRAFNTGDYAALDAMLHPAQASADDSQFAGIVTGMQALFNQRQSLENSLSQLAEWRRQRPDSDGPDLIEAILLRSWAWAARADGLIFQQRIALAQAALKDAYRAEQSSPVWHQLRQLIDQDRAQATAVTSHSPRRSSTGMTASPTDLPDRPRSS
ncbi:rhomboid family intramembrane serine protease [Peristeroidobacter soli]|uniref:rhomboid family intramembrane serine protease n=1 Tax=Peristeroidobacter soli TaxID=2497877 RepID=UPI00101D29AB|nr:rhomboid family intramembrane serine protease [Peristeroidobacter soli]